MYPPTEVGGIIAPSDSPIRLMGTPHYSPGPAALSGTQGPAGNGGEGGGLQ